MKNSKDTSWNRTSDLPICSTALPVKGCCYFRLRMRMQTVLGPRKSRSQWGPAIRLQYGSRSVKLTTYRPCTESKKAYIFSSAPPYAITTCRVIAVTACHWSIGDWATSWHSVIHGCPLAYRGGGGGSTPPPPTKFRRPSKIVPNSTRLWKMLKMAEFRMPTPQDVRKKGSKILKLPSVRNCFTLAMTNKLVVIINSLKVPKIKKILLYEMKFLVPNYSCLQNPWLGGYRPQISVLSVLNWICWNPPPPRTKFLGTSLLWVTKWKYIVPNHRPFLNH